MFKKNNVSSQVILQNIVAALTVSFVALSLGAAFGILSGRGAFAGMISAAIIASVASILGGTRIQCSGPTGPMTAVTAVLVAFANDQLVNKVVGINPDHFINISIFLSAVFLIAFGVLRLGKFITFIPNVVISGFMNGIAIIIWIDQFKKLFGPAGVRFSGSFWLNIILVSISALMVFIIPMATRKIMPKHASLLSATFLTIILLTVLSVALHLNVQTVHLTTSLHNVSDFTNLVKSQWPTNWSWQVISIAIPFAIQLAILGYLDTLMTSLVIDKMTHEKTKPNKELIAQGVAASAVSIVGGIPGAQATIRSVLMVKERANLRMAGILVGIFALVEMILFQDAINLIPQAVFSGILMKVGYDVFDWLPLRLYVKELLRRPSEFFHKFFSRHDDEKIFVTNREVILIFGTTLLTIVWDLNYAVAIFTALFYIHNRWLNTKNPMRDLKPILETEAFSDEL